MTNKAIQAAQLMRLLALPKHVNQDFSSLAGIIHALTLLCIRHQSLKKLRGSSFLTCISKSSVCRKYNRAQCRAANLSLSCLLFCRNCSKALSLMLTAYILPTRQSKTVDMSGDWMEQFCNMSILASSPEEH